MSLAPHEFEREELVELFHDLQVHQEELTAQNLQLVETQHALEESRDRYVDLYDFAPVGFMTISISGIVRQINLTGAAMLKRERSKVLGMPFDSFVHRADKPRFSEHLRQCRNVERSSATVELALNGEPDRYLQLLSKRHGDTVEGQSQLLSTLIDISERKRLEKQRREAEEARDKLERDREVARASANAKDHFLAKLSHELRTPLTPIVATLSNTKLVSLAPEPLLHALRTVQRNLDLEVRLINDLLDVTRISRDRLRLARERVSIHLVLQDVVDMLAPEIRQHGVQVITAFNASADWVIGDPTRLRQVFWNLLGNALKFTRPDGRITIVTTSGPQDVVQVSVSDTGAGMEQSMIDAINESGTTTPELPAQPASGLGLGLAICRGVIRAHGGTLSAISAGRDRGSTFVVNIPIAAHLEQWDQPSAAIAAQREPPPGARRVLLVEDHQDSADTLAELLGLHGFDVTVARSVDEAISVADRGFFDIMISDIRLPDGSGLDLIRRLRSNRPIRGIAISGFGTEEDQERSRQAGYEFHLTKPVNFDSLLDALARVSSGPRNGHPFGSV
jgi:PAS domain S-box-containing protein